MDQPAQSTADSSQSAKSRSSSGTHILYAILAVLLLAGIFGGYMAYRTQTLAAIEVNGEKVSRQFFNHRVEIQENFYKNVSPDETKFKTVKRDEADAIVNTILMEEGLRAKNAAPTESEIDQFTQESRARYEKSATSSAAISWDALLKTKYLMTPADKKYVDKRELLTQKIVKMQPQKHMSGIWLKRPGPGDGPKGEEFKAADEAVKAKADDILVKAKSGVAFDKLVADFSEDPISKPKNGDIGDYPPEFKVGEIPTSTFASMAIVQIAYEKLSVGEIQVFEYPSGYAILKIDSARGDWPYKDLNDFITQSRTKADLKINMKLN